MESYAVVRRERISLREPNLFPCGCGLSEKIQYSDEVPYSVVKQTFRNYNVMKLHFGNTMEVMVSCGVTGRINIGGCERELTGKSIFVILPNVLHSGYMNEGEGNIYGMKFSLPELKRYVDVEKMLAANGRTLADLAYSVPDYDAVMKLLFELIQSDDDIYARFACVARLFGEFDKGISMPDGIAAPSLVAERFGELLRWTTDRISEKITVDEAADFMHLSKSYFCKLFKRETGITYLSFLNQLRVSRASELLLRGKSAQECCCDCGFDSLSYFTQLFRQRTGMTTREFVMRRRRTI